MKKIKNLIFICIATTALINNSAGAQDMGIKRINHQQHDMSISGYELIHATIVIPPGEISDRHNHPGDEIIYVLEGLLEYELEGMPAVTLKAGDVLFVPAGTIHTARNVGTVDASELAAYIVEKGKPLITTFETK